MKPIIIAIAGGSASGKTSVIKELLERLHYNDDVTVISQDDYYKHYDNVPFETRITYNYDSPDSFDNCLLVNHLQELLKGNSVLKPIYDYTIFNRSGKFEEVKSTRLIIVEGIMVLQSKEIRDLADIKIFVKCDEDLRFIRRLNRDINERGRSVDSVINQYLKTVKPMFNEYIRPSASYADIIIQNDQKHDVAVDFLVSRVKDILDL